MKKYALILICLFPGINTGFSQSEDPVLNLKLLLLDDRFDEAFDAYEMALEYDPADNTIYFKIAQVYDRKLNQKKTAIEYYEKFLSGASTDQQSFNAENGSPTALERYVRERINILKEDLFFKNQLP